MLLRQPHVLIHQALKHCHGIFKKSSKSTVCKALKSFLFFWGGYWFPRNQRPDEASIHLAEMSIGAIRTTCFICIHHFEELARDLQHLAVRQETQETWARHKIMDMLMNNKGNWYITSGLMGETCVLMVYNGL